MHSLMPEIAFRRVGSMTQCTVDWKPVDVANFACHGDSLHPEGVVMHYPSRFHPLEPVASNVKISIFDRGPFRFERLCLVTVPIGQSPALKDPTMGDFPN